MHSSGPVRLILASLKEIHDAQEQPLIGLPTLRRRIAFQPHQSIKLKSGIKVHHLPSLHYSSALQGRE